MAELKWKTPVPQPRVIEDMEDFIRRLARWLADQERTADYDLEESLVLGGGGVAERLFGLEGLHASYTAPDEKTVLVAPTAPRKFVIIGLHVSTKDATANLIAVVKRKAAVDSIILEIKPDVLDHVEVVGQHKAGYITLDAADESVLIKTSAGNTGDISFSGSYLDVD